MSEKQRLTARLVKVGLPCSLRGRHFSAEGTEMGGNVLFLTCKLGRRIIIADGLVVVEVRHISGDRVELGFQADKSVRIDREEVWLVRQKENK